MPALADLEIRPHPAQARAPGTRKPLFYSDGTPVPLFPDQRSIWLGGALVGYTGTAPEAPITLIRRQPAHIRGLILDAVRRELGTQPKGISQPPSHEDVLAAERERLSQYDSPEDDDSDGDDE